MEYLRGCLKKIIGRATLTYDELLKPITEVEGILNSRPLSYVSTEDIEEPLTPSHLLIGRRALSLPDYALCQEIDNFEISPSLLNKRMKYLNKTLDHFWKRWTTEYLLELRDSHRYHGRERTTSDDTIREGDVVLVHCVDRPPGFWRLAKVESLKTGSDGHIRSATVRVHSKGTRSILLNRPLKRLYPLEINCSINSNPDSLEHEESDVTRNLADDPDSFDEEESDVTRTTENEEDALEQDVIDKSRKRPQRAAALKANDALKVYKHV